MIFIRKKIHSIKTIKLAWKLYWKLAKNRIINFQTRLFVDQGLLLYFAGYFEYFIKFLKFLYKISNILWQVRNWYQILILYHYRYKLRMSVMSVVEKTMHRLESRERCLKMLKIYGKQHERYANTKNTNDKKNIRFWHRKSFFQLLKQLLCRW